ncbi:hypothetical protein [Sutterella sp.]|uniref:hypothetical protein n=1 Tax=Sutterella sp. TaxID=1981025 RepID=UPI003FD7F4F8
MTIIIVGLAMGTAAMVLGTAVKVVQMRTAQDNRSLVAENCMARIEAAFQGRPVAELDGGASFVCKSMSDVTVDVMPMSIQKDQDRQDTEGRTNYAAVPPPPSSTGPLRLVTVKADGHTYRRLFAYPQLNATSIEISTVSVVAKENE